MLRPDFSAEAVVIGASAGAIAALGIVLPAVRHATLPILVVVHVPPHRPSMLVPLFAPKCAVPVREAFDKAPITPGIWFAPPDYHLLVETDRTLAVSADEPVNWSRPSIDVLFESAALAYGSHLAAFVLTGASADGAHGAAVVREHGGALVVEDPDTAESDVMPRSALAAGPDAVLPLPEIARVLAALATRGES